jgi:glycine cleavage system H protein
MSNRYSRDHEWVRLEGDIAVVGISNHAQEQLGDVVYVELPQAGASLVGGAEAAVVESVKAASEVYAPVSGEVIEANQAIADAPDKVNADSEGEGWFFRMKIGDADGLEKLMTLDQYTEFLKGL